MALRIEIKSKTQWKQYQEVLKLLPDPTRPEIVQKLPNPTHGSGVMTREELRQFQGFTLRERRCVVCTRFLLCFVEPLPERTKETARRGP